MYREIKPSENPLSANVIIIEAKDCYWIFDVGNGEKYLKELKVLDKPLKIVISHFHPDHMANLTQLSYEELYVGKNTYKYTNAGTIVEKPIEIDDGCVKLMIFPIPSSHAKGSLGLLLNNKYAFVGDATYPTTKNGETVYNASLLLEQIRLFEKLDCDFICRSHHDEFVTCKEEVISELKEIYTLRQDNEPYIKL